MGREAGKDAHKNIQSCMAINDVQLAVDSSFLRQAGLPAHTKGGLSINVYSTGQQKIPQSHSLECNEVSVWSRPKTLPNWDKKETQRLTKDTLKFQEHNQ